MPDHEIEGSRWIETECCVVCDEPVVHFRGRWMHRDDVEAEVRAPLEAAIEGYVLVQREAHLAHTPGEIAAFLTKRANAFQALCEIADSHGRIEDVRAALAGVPKEAGE